MSALGVVGGILKSELERTEINGGEVTKEPASLRVGFCKRFLEVIVFVFFEGVVGIVKLNCEGGIVCGMSSLGVADGDQ